jgi:hypothetical protein
VRMKTVLGLTTSAAALSVAFAASAEAASLPCGLGSNGSTGTATC